MIFTLRAKLIFLTTFLVTIVMANVTYFFTLREISEKRAAVENHMQSLARNIATMQLLDRQNWNDYQNYITQIMNFSEDVIYIAIYDERNWLRAHALDSDLIELDKPQNRMSKRAEAEIVKRLDQGLVTNESKRDLQTQRVNIQIGDRVLGSVHIGFSLIRINDQLQNRILRNITAAIIFIAALNLLSILLSSRLTGPLERLSQAMAALAGGDLKQKVRVESKDEIGQLAQTFNSMVDGLTERDIIEKLGRELQQSFNLPKLADLVRDRLTGALRADNAVLFLRTKDGVNTLREVASSDHHGKPATLQLTSAMQTALTERKDSMHLCRTKDKVKSAFSSMGWTPNTLITPMLVKDELFGLLVFSPRAGIHPFAPEQRRFATILANQVAFALENTILYDEIRKQERYKRELEIAHEVQMKLLPETMPKMPNYDFDGLCQSAQDVGGDYYDFFPIDENRLGITIADVSGKGTSAAFYMAEIKGMMSSLSRIYGSPKHLIREVNRQLYASFEKTLFATLVYGILDTKAHTFHFVRAGHNAPIHIKADGAFEMPMPTGIGLGLDCGHLFDSTLEERTLAIEPGETLMLYTDGITEAMNHQKEEYGEDRLLRMIQNKTMDGGVCLRERLFEDISAFVDGASQHDDLTIVIIRRLPA